MTKFEWRKHAKQYYLPKQTPEIIVVPNFKFLTIHGAGNPNSTDFMARVEALYKVSYALKMLPKKGFIPDGYFDYTVFPLEGVWDFNDDAKASNTNWTKDQLIYKLMIRQPDFITTYLVLDIIKKLSLDANNKLLNEIELIELEEDVVVQCLHLGSYDDEPQTFAKMEKFCNENNIKRNGLCHREIYLSDARKVAVDKLQTVLRFSIAY